jgi:anti-sigma B factor antagonist
MLEYQLRQAGDVCIVDLKGPITLGEALAYAGAEPHKDQNPPLELGSLVRNLLTRGHRKILLNLSQVSYIDSTGIGELVGAFTSVREKGGELKLLNPAVRVVYVLRITRLNSFFPVEADEAAALRSFAVANIA